MIRLGVVRLHNVLTKELARTVVYCDWSRLE